MTGMASEWSQTENTEKYAIQRPVEKQKKETSTTICHRPVQVVTRYTSCTHMDPWQAACPHWPDLNSQPKRPGDLDHLTLKVVSVSRVTWVTTVSIFSLPRPLCSWLRPDVRDRPTSDVHHRLMPHTRRGGDIISRKTGSNNRTPAFNSN